MEITIFHVYVCTVVIFNMKIHLFLPHLKAYTYSLGISSLKYPCGTLYAAGRKYDSFDMNFEIILRDITAPPQSTNN
jgi:hypothetical protein